MKTRRIVCKRKRKKSKNSQSAAARNSPESASERGRGPGFGAALPCIMKMCALVCKRIVRQPLGQGLECGKGGKISGPLPAGRASSAQLLGLGRKWCAAVTQHVVSAHTQKQAAVCILFFLTGLIRLMLSKKKKQQLHNNLINYDAVHVVGEDASMKVWAPRQPDTTLRTLNQWPDWSGPAETRSIGAELVLRAPPARMMASTRFT